MKAIILILTLSTTNVWAGTCSDFTLEEVAAAVRTQSIEQVNQNWITPCNQEIRTLYQQINREVNILTLADLRGRYTKAFYNLGYVLGWNAGRAASAK